MADHPIRLACRVAAGEAGAGGSRIDPARAVTDCDLAHRLLRRRNRILDEQVHLRDVPLFDPVQGVEIAYLPADTGGKVGDIEAGDRANPQAPRHQRLPVSFEPSRKRRDQAEAGYHHALITAAFHLSLAAPFFGAL